MNRLSKALVAAVLLAACGTATAQVTPNPLPYSAIGGAVPLTVSTSSSRSPLPANNIPFGAITLYNRSTNDAFYALGDVTVTATTGSIPIRAGTFLTQWVGSNTYIAAITATGSTNIDVYQATGPINFGSSNGGGGGGGGGPCSVFGTAAGTCAQGNDSRLTGALQASNNLSDVVTPATALSNLGGIGAATTNTFLNKTFDTAGAGNSLLINGTAITAVSGTGAVCLASGSVCAGGGFSFANPTATIGASAVNGVAATAMRSDAAPALPSTLPAVNGSLLTNLNGSNIASGTIGVARGGTGLGSGTSGGIPYFASTSSMSSSAALTANNPVLGGGAGSSPVSGTRSGNTTVFGTVSGGLVAGNGVKVDASGNLADLTYVPAPAGLGAVVATSQTPNVADFAAFKWFTGNANTLTVTVPLSSTLQSNGGGYLWTSPSASNSFGVTPNGSDTLNGGSAGVGTTGCYGLTLVSTNGSGADFAPCFGSAIFGNSGTSGHAFGFLDGTNTYSGQQGVTITPLTASGSTFTPTGVTNDYSMTLASGGNTIANPSSGFGPGVTGCFDIKQPPSGAAGTVTWGNKFKYQGGIGTLALSAANNAVDHICGRGTASEIDIIGVSLAPS